jgi:hypothetical protein
MFGLVKNGKQEMARMFMLADIGLCLLTVDLFGLAGIGHTKEDGIGFPDIGDTDNQQTVLS